MFIRQQALGQSFILTLLTHLNHEAARSNHPIVQMGKLRLREVPACKFPVAALTKYQYLGVLSRLVFSPVLRPGVTRAGSFWVSEENVIPASLQLLVAAGDPWGALAGRGISPASSFSSLHLFSPKDTCCWL